MFFLELTKEDKALGPDKHPRVLKEMVEQVTRMLTCTISIHPLEPYSVQSVGAAEAVSLAIGHNPGRVATPTQDTRMTRSSPASWYSFCQPLKDGRLSQPPGEVIQWATRLELRTLGS